MEQMEQEMEAWRKSFEEDNEEDRAARERAARERARQVRAMYMYVHANSPSLTPLMKITQV